MSPEREESRIVRVETVVFGVEGQGGLLSRMTRAEKQLATHEKLINTIQVKLIVFIGIGSYVFTKVLDFAVSHLVPFAKSLP